MRRPADEDVMKFIGDREVTARELYAHFGAKDDTSRTAVRKTLISLVRYRFLSQRAENGMYIYKKV